MTDWRLAFPNAHSTRALWDAWLDLLLSSYVQGVKTEELQCSSHHNHPYSHATTIPPLPAAIPLPPPPVPTTICPVPIAPNAFPFR